MTADEKGFQYRVVHQMRKTEGIVLEFSVLGSEYRVVIASLFRPLVSSFLGAFVSS